MSLSTTTYVTLGLIAKHPGSGYEIAALAARSIAHFWPIPKSQLYSELTRLADLGFVAGTAVRQDRFPDKRVYEVTPAGLVALREWLDDLTVERLRSKNAALVKFFFGAFMSPERLAPLVREYRLDAERRRAELVAIADRLESQLTPERLFGLATIRHGILQAEAAVAWTFEAEDLIRRASAAKEITL
ncbi:MAG: PadR family transcriptional regulator [Geodermatophilaceae bacterium]|jgi:DNA-binding PadR family transcriptional regulator